MPWLRLYAKTIDDEKIRLLSFEDRWHFVALLCCKCAGLLDADDDPVMLRRKLSVKLGLAPRELEAMALRLEELDLIDHETFQPVSWNALQYKSDRSTERVRKHRERVRKQQEGVKKAVESKPSHTKRQRNVSVTPPDTDTDTDKSKETSSLEQPEAARGSAAFESWWAVYPKKVGKKPCITKWKAKKLDAQADRLVADVEKRIVEDGRWLEGYIPNPATYITQERWNDEVQPKRGAPQPTAPAAPARDWRASVETPLEKAVNWARQQRRMDLIDDAECERLIAQATAQHREAAHA